MGNIHIYDKNYPKTWPQEDRDGKYVLVKAKKEYGLYTYYVELTKAFKKPRDGVAAWMRIPKTLQIVGEPPVKEIPGCPNPRMGDIGLMDNAEYIYDGKYWLFYRDLDEWEARLKMESSVKQDRAFTEPKRIDEVDRMYQEMVRKVINDRDDKKDKGPESTKKCVCLEGWLVFAVFAIGLFFGLFIRVNLA